MEYGKIILMENFDADDNYTKPERNQPPVRRAKPIQKKEPIDHTYGNNRKQFDLMEFAEGNHPLSRTHSLEDISSTPTIQRRTLDKNRKSEKRNASTSNFYNFEKFQNLQKTISEKQDNIDYLLEKNQNLESIIQDLEYIIKIQTMELNSLKFSHNKKNPCNIL